MAGVAAPASLGSPLSYHRRVVATKFTTSYNYPDNAQLVYVNNSTAILFLKCNVISQMLSEILECVVDRL